MALLCFDFVLVCDCVFLFLFAFYGKVGLLFELGVVESDAIRVDERMKVTEHEINTLSFVETC